VCGGNSEECDRLPKKVYVLLTMDCETARCDVTPYGLEMSGSGPADYEESARSICGFVETAERFGYPVTLLTHPEVAIENRELLLKLQAKGACLGLHVHPYKLKGKKHKHDLGAYPANEQREILQQAMASWGAAIGSAPRYFRAGYFSANDFTFGVLEDLGFLGGSLSNPGRVLPEHCSVWAGAEPYPHRAHSGFRLIRGESDFVNVPVSGAFGRPVARGHAGEQGFEWSYIPHTYDHKEIIRDVVDRFKVDCPRFGTIVTDTHNDQDYTDPNHPSSQNLLLMLESITEYCGNLDLEPVGITLDALCELVLAENNPTGNLQ
jgi:hypothetical protein